MKLVEYAPFVFGFLIGLSLILLIVGVAKASPAGGPQIELAPVKARL